MAKNGNQKRHRGPHQTKNEPTSKEEAQLSLNEQGHPVDNNGDKDEQ